MGVGGCGGREKRKGEGGRERERLIQFKKLAHTILEAGKFKIHRAG